MTERPIVNVKRSAQIKDGEVLIDSTANEKMSVDKFHDLYRTKIQEQNSLRQQVNAITSQLYSIENRMPELDPDRQARLDKLREDMRLIASLDKVEELRNKAREMEVQSNLLKEDLATFSDVKNQLKPQEQD